MKQMEVATPMLPKIHTERNTHPIHAKSRRETSWDRSINIYNNRLNRKTVTRGLPAHCAALIKRYKQSDAKNIHFSRCPVRTTNRLIFSCCSLKRALECASNAVLMSCMRVKGQFLGPPTWVSIPRIYTKIHGNPQKTRANRTF